MGGAEDMPQRSSSPLKRPASELEPDVPSSIKQEDVKQEDVDMVMVPDTQEEIPNSIAAPTALRAASIDMLKDEPGVETSAPSEPATENDPKTQVPPIDTQVATVTTLCKAESERQLNEGDKTYLVSKKWLERVTSRSSESNAKSKESLEGEIGPIDNSDIVQQIIPQPGREDFVQLKHGIGEDFFQLFPVDAWDMVVEWYGLMKGTKAIIRLAHNTNPDKSLDAFPNVTYEYHPPVFHIHRVWSELGKQVDASLKAENPDAPVIVASRSMRMHDFLKLIKEAAGIPMKQKVRLWRVPRTLPAAEPALPTAVGTATPPSSRPGTPTVEVDATIPEAQDSWKKLLLPVTDFTKVERDSGRVKVDFLDSTANENYNGTGDLDLFGLGDDQAIVIDELVEGKDGYVSNTKHSPNGKLNGTGRKGNSSFIVSSQNNSGRNSPAPPAGPSSGYNLRSSRGKSKNGRTAGAVGLFNLGNTCYMNSALQCLRSVEELTKYFLKDSYKEELNTDNPLGHHGNVAEAYAALLRDIYKEPPPTSVQPRNFKNIVSRYATQFSGYGQQDSQEFVGFLLDGLQEDLSRVKKKPYIEKPDSTDEMIGDPEAIREMATKVWNITKQRDDSVIADLFTGMYKSTLVCPHCEKVSITFDPFNNMTLQLPIENVWCRTVYFYPLNDAPVSLVVEIDKQASFGTLKKLVSKKVGVPVERLFTCEVYERKFFKWFFDPTFPAEEIKDAGDLVVLYELEAKPTNLEKFTKSKAFGKNNDEALHLHWDSPEAESMLVPVFNRRLKHTWNGKKNNTWELTAAPYFIVLTPQEARSEEAIKRKLLEKVATLTTWPPIHDDQDPSTSSASDIIDPDLVVTTGSDADSSKFVAHSLDGEDELVDVAMKDSNSTRESGEDRSTPPLKSFNTSRPKWVDPAEYLPGELQNLFEICYLADPKGGITTGWNMNLDSTAYPKISERNPQVQQMNGDDTSYDYDAINSRAGSVSSKSSRESSDGVNGFVPTQTRMNDESSDEEELNPTSPKRALPVRTVAPNAGARVGHKNKRNKRNMKTYSKKGKSAVHKRPQFEVDYDQDAPDDGPLVRLGEGLVLNWNDDAWDTLFNGISTDRDDRRGQPTWEHPSQLDDPELNSRRKARDTRRKQGLTLDDCLDEFGKEEILSETDTWYCPRCKEHRRASKKFEIWRTPDVLIMHLKRFSSNGMRRDKLDVLVDFPIDGLDLSSRVIEAQDGKEEIYDLIGVDDHWGGLGGGHYTAFAKNFVDHEWYECNDATVSKIKDPSRVVTASAYLLFYRRRSSEPLGGKIVREIVESFDPVSSDEDDSGEGSRLDATNSSQHGSSSALTGVEAVHHQPDHSSEDGGVRTTVNHLEGLPPYIETLYEGSVPFGGQFDYSDVRATTEPDEGIDMGMNYNNSTFNPVQSWGFGKLGDLEKINQNSPVGSEGVNRNSPVGSDAGGDVGSNDSAGILYGSEADQATRDQRELEWNDAMVSEDYVEPESLPDFEFDSPNVNEVLAKSAAMKTRSREQEFNYEVPIIKEEEEVEEPAAEIHLEDSEELKMD